MVAGMSTEKRKPGRPPKSDSKRQQGGDRHRHPRKTLSLTRHHLDAMTRYRESLEYPPDEGRVLRTALEHFLRSKGFWPPPAKS